MRLGAENRKELVLLAALLALAAGFAWRSASSSPQAVAANVGSAAAPAETGRGPLINNLDPSLRFDLLRSSAGVRYQGTGRNIFRAEPDLPKPQFPPVQPRFIGPPTAPPPPPINLTFYGYASGPGAPRRVFLAQGGDIFIAKEGDIVDRRYKIDRINADSVEVTDLITNSTQPLRLSAGPANPEAPQ